MTEAIIILLVAANIGATAMCWYLSVLLRDALTSWKHETGTLVDKIVAMHNPEALVTQKALATMEEIESGTSVMYVDEAKEVELQKD